MAENLSSMEKEVAYMGYVGETKGWKPLGGPMSKYEDNIKIGIR
jgi:hypothetical protein